MPSASAASCSAASGRQRSCTSPTRSGLRVGGSTRAGDGGTEPIAGMSRGAISRESNLWCMDAARAGTDGGALLEALFEGAPVGLALWDEDLRYRRVNARLAEINGLPV